jgi:hypothetical protein
MMNPFADEAESYTAGATAYLEFLEGRTAAAKLPRDGDKDGRIFDGTKREMPAPVVPRVPSILKADKVKTAPNPEPVADLSTRSRERAAKGGVAQKANTSAYPVDVLPVVKPTDDHPDAPGADNLAAVRGYRGISGTEVERRVPRLGETIDVYRDLMRGGEHKRGFPDRDAFSLRQASSANGNSASKVVASSVGVELTNPRVAWAAAEKNKVEADPKNIRGVHAFLRGEVAGYLSPDEAAAIVAGDGWVEVTYYPGTQDFFLPGSRVRVIGAERAIASQGRMYVKGPLTVPEAGETPLSAIEKRMMENGPILKASKMVSPPPNFGTPDDDDPFAGFRESPEQIARREAAEAERLRVQERWDELYPDGEFVAPGGVDTSGYETLTREQSKLRKAQFQPLTGEVAYLSYEEEGFEWDTIVSDIPTEQLTAVGRAALLGLSPEGRDELARAGGGRVTEMLLAGEWDPAIDRVWIPDIGTSTELYREPPEWQMGTVRDWEAKAREASLPGYAETGFGSGQLDPEQLDKVRNLRMRLMEQDEVTADDQRKIDLLTDVINGKSDLPDFAVFTFLADYFRDELQKSVDASRERFPDGTVAEGWAHNIDEAFAVIGSNVMQRAISSWAGDGNRFGLIPLERGVADEFGVPYVENPRLSEAVKTDTDLLYEASPEAWQTAARTIYDNTQAILEAQGITEVLLYRGVGNERTGPFDSPLTSWSISPNVAQQFATKQYQVRVPADRVFGAPMTGLGKSEEAELVLLPSDVPVAEVKRGATGLPRMFDTWLDYDEEIDDALSAKPLLKANALVEQQVDAPTTEPLFRVKGGKWQTSDYLLFDQIEDLTADNVEVLLPGSRPGDAPVPYGDYLFRQDYSGLGLDMKNPAAKLNWTYQDVSVDLTTAAAEMTGVADMPGSGWWSDDVDDATTDDYAKALLDEIREQDLTTMTLWSGQPIRLVFGSAEAGDVVAVPLMALSPSRGVAQSYASGDGRKWIQDPTGRLALQWEQGDEKKRADLATAVTDPAIGPLLLGDNRTLRTEPATGTDRNLIVQFATAKVAPIRNFEGITSGQYRVKSVQDVPDPDGLAYWDAEAGEFRHTPARLVTVEFVDDLSVQPLDRQTVEREVLLKSNAMAQVGGLPEGAEDFLARVDRSVQTDRVNSPVSDDWRNTYDARWKFVPEKVRDWALRAGGLQAFDYDTGFDGRDGAQVVAGAQLYVDLIDTETTTDFPLWRGDPYIRGRQVGDTFVEIRGFSADRDTARKFSRGGWVYRVEPGDARVVALDLSGDGSRLIGEKEVVVGGTFEVTAVDPDNKVVTLKQVAALPESELARRLRRSGNTIVEDLEQPAVLSLPEPVLTSNAMRTPVRTPEQELRIATHVDLVRERMDTKFDNLRQFPLSGPSEYEWNGQRVESTEDTIVAARTVQASAADNLAVQVPVSALPKIIADGRLKSQFESGTSRGSYDPDMRRRLEGDVMGISVDTADRERPVYGFVEGGGEMEPQIYGEFTLRLSPSLADRTTITFGDSFDVQNGAAVPVVGDVTDDEILGAYNGYANIVPNYIEAQIRGGVSLDDVTEVVLRPGRRESEWQNTALLRYAKNPLPGKRLVLEGDVAGVEPKTLQALAAAGVEVVDGDGNPLGPVLKSNAVRETADVDLEAITRPGKPFRWKDTDMSGKPYWVTGTVSRGTVNKRLNALRKVLEEELPELQGRDFTVDYWTDWDEYKAAVTPGPNGYPLARWEPENNRVVISPSIALRWFYEDGTGSTDTRTVMHELVHAASPQTVPNSGPEPVLEEAMAEILSMDIANRRIADFGRVTNTLGESGLRRLARDVAYPDRVASVIMNAASEVGWDRDAVMARLMEWRAEGSYAPHFKRFEYRSDGLSAGQYLDQRAAAINKQYDDLIARLPEYADEYERTRQAELDALWVDPQPSWEYEARQRWEESVATATAAGVDLSAIVHDFTDDEYWVETTKTREEASVIDTTASSLVYWLLGGDRPTPAEPVPEGTPDARDAGWGETIDAPSEYWGTDYTLTEPEAPRPGDLENAVQEWVVNDPEEVRAPFQSIMAQSGIGPWADEHARETRRRLAALLNALETQGQVMEGTLFRGIAIDNESEVDLESIAMDLPSVGRTIDLPPSGFTTRRDVADRFAEVEYYQYGAGHVSVIYHLAPGAKALELNRIYNPGYLEGEMLVGGRFTVTDRKIDEDKGIIHLYLTQAESIGAPTDGPVGEWR